MIRFTAVDMVVGETSSIDHLVSVYQSDANAVSDEDAVQKVLPSTFISQAKRYSGRETAS
jgi:hypothetical protein